MMSGTWPYIIQITSIPKSTEQTILKGVMGGIV